MPPFRFNIPFFSYGSPSRLSPRTSSSSPSPSPPPTPPSRPPFRPAGIAQPSKPATSQETKSKLPPSLSRVKSNAAAIADSSSRGATTPPGLEKQSNQSGSPSKKHESLEAEEQKVTMKEKPSRDYVKEGGNNVNPVKEKPHVARKEAEEAKKSEVKKLAVEGKKKAIIKDMGESSNTAQEQHKRREETEKLAMQEKKKIAPKDMEENSKAAQEQRKKEETEKLIMEEKKKTLHKDMGENSKEAQEQQKTKQTEKLAAQERNRAFQTAGKEDATRSKTTRHTAAASESTRGPPERTLQRRTEIHTDDNRQKAKGESTSNHSASNRESLMSRRIKEDIRDGLSKLTWGASNNNDEKSVSVFTLTGENRGATMAIGSEKGKKDDEVHIRRGYRSNPDESPNTTSSETQGERKLSKNRNPEDEDDKEARVKAYVNGNTQAVNNSIVCDSSVNENDPGVHMSFRFEEIRKEVMNPPENVKEKKGETVTATSTGPRVRRRCLRGLLAESSESDNPLKPRRHGCRFTCKDKDIENT